MKGLYAVIMAGGKGTRFWPCSRESLPKQLLSIAGERTMIQATLDRLTPFLPPENVLILTGAPYLKSIRKQLPNLPPKNIIVEPEAKNTAPCIALATAVVQEKEPDAVMIVLPSDHIITDTDRYHKALDSAVKAARFGPYLVTIGIRPAFPETGYGYIEMGEPVPIAKGERVYTVRRFREKPSREVVEGFLAQGNFLWNSGMFVWTAHTILSAFMWHMPQLYRGIKKICETLGKPQAKKVIKQMFSEIDPISIDYGIMEKYEKVLVVEGDFGWSDMGSWASLSDIMPRDQNGHVGLGELASVDSRDSIIYAQGKLVALVGVENLVVVDTDDAILVCRKDQAQDVRKVIDNLKSRGMTQYL